MIDKPSDPPNLCRILSNHQQYNNSLTDSNKPTWTLICYSHIIDNWSVMVWCVWYDLSTLPLSDWLWSIYESLRLTYDRQVLIDHQWINLWLVVWLISLWLSAWHGITYSKLDYLYCTFASHSRHACLPV